MTKRKLIDLINEYNETHKDSEKFHRMLLWSEVCQYTGYTIHSVRQEINPQGGHHVCASAFSYSQLYKKMIAKPYMSKLKNVK